MVGKKGYVRTAEAMIAIVITFVFATLALQQQSIVLGDITEPINPLASLNDNEIFRTCVINEDVVCIEQFAKNRLGGGYSYIVNISSNPSVDVGGIPDVRIFADSLYVTGNTSQISPKIVRLYYWTNR